jgi:putative DNA primase/helicase
LLICAPEISGAGTGKGLLVRSICAVAFGVRPRAFTKGGDCNELDKRLTSDLIEAAPIVFLDNVNGSMLRSDTLASVLTERPARVRPLGRTGMVALNSTAFFAVTGNGLTLSEDLARRFIVCELDAHCEDPEQRRFGSGFLEQIESRRPELLSAALTIWRWSRQNTADLDPGRPLGSFEDWTECCRDPLLALGCRDPVERIDTVKSDDPHRRQIVGLFEAWHRDHGERPIKAADLAEPVRTLVDPRGRGRQFIATRLSQLTGTRAGGFVLDRQKATGKWGATTYALRPTPAA